MKKIKIGIFLSTITILSGLYHVNAIPKVNTSNKFKMELSSKIDVKYVSILDDIKSKGLKSQKIRLSKTINKTVNKKNKNIKKSKYSYVKITLTYYTSLPSENGGFTVTCTGKQLEYGMIASNYYKLGTKIKLGDIGTFIVSDRGSNNFNSPNRLDVFVPKNDGETDTHYIDRVNNMGRKTVYARIINGR